MAVRGDENVRERKSVSGPRTGISCDCEARMGEKLDSKEMRKTGEFEVKMKVVKTEARATPEKKVWSKWVETRKDPNKPWCESSGVSHREGST